MSREFFVKRLRQYLRPTWRGVIFGALFGCIPAMLGGWALVTSRVSFRARAGDRFVAMPDTDATGYWMFVGMLCLAALLIWAKTIADMVSLMRSEHRRNSERGISHDA